jgi:hypothetical protein
MEWDVFLFFEFTQNSLFQEHIVVQNQADWVTQATETWLFCLFIFIFYNAGT